MLLQTDKSLYKPSDMVHFRVIVLNHETKPYRPSNVEIYIKDGNRNRVKEFLDVELTHGVFKGDLKLSDSPVTGNWEIIVKVDHDNKEKVKSFEVAKYVLPKFEVLVSCDPPFVKVNDEKMKITVKAKYTFGKEVKGNATIGIIYKNNNFWKSDLKSTKCVHFNGKLTLDFDLNESIMMQSERELEVFAVVEDEVTGSAENDSLKLQVFQHSHEIFIDKVYSDFKPGLPYKFYVNGKFPDGSPISDSFNPVKITLNFHEGLQVDDLQWKKLKSMKTEYVFLVNGIAELNIELSPDSLDLEIEVSM